MVTMASPWYPRLTLSLPDSFSALFLLGNALPNKVDFWFRLLFIEEPKKDIPAMCPLPCRWTWVVPKFSKIAYNAVEVTILGHTSWCTCVCFSRMFLAWNCRIIGYPILQFCQILPSSFFFFFQRFLFIWLCRVLVEACDILVSLPGIKHGPRAMGARSLSHWTTRKAPQFVLEVPTYFSSLFHP